jgi:hypothetical protein
MNNLIRAYLSAGSPGTFIKVCKAMVEKMQEEPDQGAFDLFVSTVEDGDTRQSFRTAAMDALGDLGSKASAAVEPLLKVAMNSNADPALRFAATDAVEKISPAHAKKIHLPKSLGDRKTNRTERLSYHEALCEEAEKQKKEFVFYILLTLFLGGVMVTGCILFGTNSPALLPFFLSLGGLGVLAVIRWFLKWKQCPTCRHFFARGDLQQEGTYQNTSSVQLPSGGTGHRIHTVTVYRTQCKYCNAQWRVFR